MERVETAAKAPKEAVPVFKSQEADAPATVAEVQQEVSSATTKVCVVGVCVRLYVLCCGCAIEGWSHVLCVYVVMGFMLCVVG